jgi:RNA polymerase sigma-70 factor, ECF subfamily
MSREIAVLDDSELTLDQLDDELLATLFQQHRVPLLQHIRNRLDSRLTSRCDPSDVLQDAFLTAKNRLPRRRLGIAMHALTWIWLEVDQMIAQCHRLNRRLKRSPRSQELSICARSANQTEGAFEGIDFAGTDTSPSNVAIRNESKNLIHSVLNELTESERSILSLRHFELMTNNECAQILGINPKTASERYRRALISLNRRVQSREKNSGLDR